MFTHLNSLANTSGSQRSLAISQWRQHAKHLVCVVVPTVHDVQRLADELQFFEAGLEAPPILVFPDWETLPYDYFSPHHDIVSERLTVLAKLKTLKKGLLIIALPTLLHTLPPYEFIAAHSFYLSVGDVLDIDAFSLRLQSAGYHLVKKVMEHGEYAIRGSIVDLYPMGSPHPFRMDLLDEDIDSIRLFDVDTQCSSQKIEKMQVLPAREFPLDEKGIAQFRRAWRHRFDGNPANCSVYNNISDGMAPAGIEYYLPLFFETAQKTTLFDYLAPETQFLLLNETETLQAAGEQFLHEVNTRYEQRRHDATQPILPPDSLFVDWNEWQALLAKFPHEYCQGNVMARPSVTTKMLPAEIVKKIRETHPNSRLLLCAQTTGRRELLMEQLTSVGIVLKPFEHWNNFLQDTAPFGIIQGPLETGFTLTSPALIVITEADLFGETLVRQQKRTRHTVDKDTVIRDLSELFIGAAVVHIEHGVGRYLGLQPIEHDGQVNEFLVLEYAAGDKIYVPVTALEKISRYTGLDPEHAPLHKLGSGQWQKEKKKAQEKIHDTAVELLEIYAKREAKVGFSYMKPDQDYAMFTAGFPFEETPDQQRAIDNVLSDMQASRPMDRLICGDVGFGKTEVAMRACFLAVQNHKQVCILVPTTLLAGQHYENFCDRFAEFGVNIELLSRFRTHQAAKEVIEKLEKGTVDIVVGTHALLSKKIKFSNLGLLIIDEEHRFGVKQKEFLKGLRNEVDILSMTATPIPRTLNMSLSGLRDISIIATPPLRRLAIKTFRLETNDALIREAVLREIMRGGQVFYLHNQVSSIQGTADHLLKILPEASIQVAHGQMPERLLEKVMSDFYHRRFQVLVCSTIIETGIDIPTANTIIIDRADRFGLAQLHQLRGRVGRSHHQAYAYLLTPPPEAMTADAQKRLDAIVAIEDLGAGFQLATHDLEIRGAGELLGDEQSGNMHAIGFSLYMELLEEAIEALKSGKTPELDKPTQHGADISLGMSLIIPEAYMPDVNMRLIFYKRIAHAENVTQLDALHVEIIDRFGLLPISVKNLFRTMALKFTAMALGIKKISGQKEVITLEFEAQHHVNPATIIKLIQVQPKTYKLNGPSRLQYHITPDDDRIEAVGRCLQTLSLL